MSQLIIMYSKENQLVVHWLAQQWKNIYRRSIVFTHKCWDMLTLGGKWKKSRGNQE